MTDDSKQSGWIVWAVVSFTAMLVLYPLSIGPVIWFSDGDLLPEWYTLCKSVNMEGISADGSPCDSQSRVLRILDSLVSADTCRRQWIGRRDSVCDELDCLDISDRKFGGSYASLSAELNVWTARQRRDGDGPQLKTTPGVPGRPGVVVANSGYKSATALTTAAGVPVVGQSELLRNGCQPGAICRCLAGLGLSPKLPSWFEE